MVKAAPSIDAAQRPTRIYQLTDPDTGEVRYIGKTVSPSRTRFNAHLGSARRGTRLPVSLWIRSLLRVGKKPGWEIIEVVPPEGDWAAREIFWIAYFRSRRLLNLDVGGEGGALGRKQPEAFKAKMSALFKGRQIPEYQRAIISAAQKGRVRTPEHLAAMSVYFTGRLKHSAEARAKIGAASAARKRSEETKEKARLSNLGKRRSPETVEKIRQSRLGKPRSPEAIAKFMVTMAMRKETNAPRKRRAPHSEATRAKMSATHSKSSARHGTTSLEGSPIDGITTRARGD